MAELPAAQRLTTLRPAIEAMRPSVVGGGRLGLKGGGKTAPDTLSATPCTGLARAGGAWAQAESTAAGPCGPAGACRVRRAADSHPKVTAGAPRTHPKALTQGTWPTRAAGALRARPRAGAPDVGRGWAPALPARGPRVPPACGAPVPARDRGRGEEMAFRTDTERPLAHGRSSRRAARALHSVWCRVPVC